MTDLIAETARAAAAKLAADLGPGLAADVEAALSTRGSAQRPEQYIDPAALGSLVVSVAALAWTVYNDVKARTARPSREVVARRVRVELRNQVGAATKHDDHVIDVVVDEIQQITDSG